MSSILRENLWYPHLEMSLKWEDGVFFRDECTMTSFNHFSLSFELLIKSLSKTCIISVWRGLDHMHSITAHGKKIFLYICIRVLDNLKDYAVRALVNAVDHLGTVAYKLTDLLEQQTSEVSTIELNISCVNQVNF